VQLHVGSRCRWPGPFINHRFSAELHPASCDTPMPSGCCTPTGLAVATAVAKPNRTPLPTHVSKLGSSPLMMLDAVVDSAVDQLCRQD